MPTASSSRASRFGGDASFRASFTSASRMRSIGSDVPAADATTTVDASGGGAVAAGAVEGRDAAFSAFVVDTRLELGDTAVAGVATLLVGFLDDTGGVAFGRLDDDVFDAVPVAAVVAVVEAPAFDFAVAAADIWKIPFKCVPLFVSSFLSVEIQNPPPHLTRTSS
jgi:hypothetical protein